MTSVGGSKKKKAEESTVMMTKQKKKEDYIGNQFLLVSYHFHFCIDKIQLLLLIFLNFSPHCVQVKIFGKKIESVFGCNGPSYRIRKRVKITSET